MEPDATVSRDTDNANSCNINSINTNEKNNSSPFMHTPMEISINYSYNPMEDINVNNVRVAIADAPEPEPKHLKLFYGATDAPGFNVNNSESEPEGDPCNNAWHPYRHEEMLIINREKHLSILNCVTYNAILNEKTELPMPKI